MKALDLARVRGRGVFRVVSAVLGRPQGWGRLALRLDDLDAPAPFAGAALDLLAWQGVIVDRLAEGGTVPVEVVGRAGHPWLVEVARFAARLDCPVTVRTAGRLEDHGAEGLGAGGVRRVLLVGVDTDAVAALVRARRSLQSSLDVLVEVPPGADLEEISARLRGVGADGVRVAAPWRGGPWGAEMTAWIEGAAARVASYDRSDRNALHELARMDGRGPGAPRRTGHCAVGGLRLEVGPDGGMYACPHQEQRLPPGGDPRSGLAGHRTLIRACDRVCLHPDLAGPAAR